jgi:hypothetical protein
MPLGIHAATWATQRQTNLGGDGGILDMALKLETPGVSPSDANAALLFFDEPVHPFDGTVDTTRLASQMTMGVFPDDLPGGRLGPATRALASLSATALKVGAMRRAKESSLNAHLAAVLNSLAGSRRVFPLYDNVHDPADDSFVDLGGGVGTVDLVGFVAARILGASVEGSPPNDRLTLTVEPCFVIHHTVWTLPPDDPAAPERNTYVHKLRLSR